MLQMFLLETDQQDSISFKQFKTLLKKMAIYRSSLVVEDKDKSKTQVISELYETMGLNSDSKYKESFFPIRKGFQQGVAEKVGEIRRSLEKEECRKDREALKSQLDQDICKHYLSF